VDVAVLSQKAASRRARERMIDLVGQRSPTESLAAILSAFLQERTWAQSELARELGLSVPATKKRLEELLRTGVPLERIHDPPQVYWSVSKHWFPGGVVFQGDAVRELLRLLARLPRSKSRDALLDTVLRTLPKSTNGQSPLGNAIMQPAAKPGEEEQLAVLEDAARAGKAIHFRYYTANRGDDALRHASVHRVVVGPPARFIATCHRSDTLKWFRVDNVSLARIEEMQRFRAAEAAAVDAFIAASLDGFNEGGAPKVHTFFVSAPESKWVAKNLLEGMRAEPIGGGIRVTVETAGLSRLARYVTALGAAGRPETRELARAVAAIASGALKAATEADAQMNEGT
jgi:predicted DNA-binding transcriptional regulator YafY